MDHAKRAKALFCQGYNCSQAVFCAFVDETGLDLETAARLASSFGGGLGRLREVCGTISAAAMVLGIVKGYFDPQDLRAKAAHYQLVRDFAERFHAAEGSIVCRELLTKANVDPKIAKSGGDPKPGHRNITKSVRVRSSYGEQHTFWRNFSNLNSDDDFVRRNGEMQ